MSCHALHKAGKHRNGRRRDLRHNGVTRTTTKCGSFRARCCRPATDWYARIYDRRNVPWRRTTSRSHYDRESPGDHRIICRLMGMDVGTGRLLRVVSGYQRLDGTTSGDRLRPIRQRAESPSRSQITCSIRRRQQVPYNRNVPTRSGRSSR